MTYEQAKNELLPGDRVRLEHALGSSGTGVIRSVTDGVFIIDWASGTVVQWGSGAPGWARLSRLDEPVPMTKDLLPTLRVGDYLAAKGSNTYWDVVEVSLSGDVFTLKNRHLGHSEKSNSAGVNTEAWLSYFNLVRRRPVATPTPPTREEQFKGWLTIQNGGNDVEFTINGRTTTLADAFKAGYDYGIHSQAGIKAAQADNDELRKKVVSVENQLASANETNRLQGEQIKTQCGRLEIAHRDLRNAESAREHFADKLRKINALTQ